MRYDRAVGMIDGPRTALSLPVVGWALRGDAL
jgi:hypothetical protein